VKGVLVEILNLISRRGLLAPGDAASQLGAPRYKVLAAFHCLEELGLIEAIYKRGSYKVYKVSRLGEAVLAKLGDSSLANILELSVSSNTYHGHEKGEATS
jgi:DNA-binding IclR family transcriptional regulator